jgi:hypothetical protein
MCVPFIVAPLRSARAYAFVLALLVSGSSGVVRADEPVPSPAPSAPRILASLDDGFGVESEDGAFGVRMGALLQYRVQLNEAADGEFRPSFQTFMVRPTLRMHAFGQKLRIFVQPEFAGTSARLLDLELTYQPHAAFAIRAGQFLTPFSRTFFTPVPLMQFVDFGIASDVFRVNRDTGVMLFGTPAEGRFEYYVGAFNGNAIDRDPNERVRGMGVARIAVAPLGRVAYDQTPFLAASQPLRFALGLNGYLQRVVPTHTETNLTTGQTSTVQDPERRNHTVGADLALYVDRFAFLGEVYYRDQQIIGGARVHAIGAYAQMGYYLAPARLELAARVSYVDPNRDAPLDSVHTYETALTGYVHGNHAKIALRYLFADANTSLSGLYAGRQHRLTLQTQVFF